MKKIFKIYSEGLPNFGDMFHGEFYATNFNEAIQIMLKCHPGLKESYSQKKNDHYIWNCKLYTI